MDQYLEPDSCFLFLLFFLALSLYQRRDMLEWATVTTRWRVPLSTQITTCAIDLTICGLFLHGLHWMSYANNGQGWPVFLHAPGRFCILASRQCIQVMLLLIAKNASTTIVSKEGRNLPDALRNLYVEQPLMVKQNFIYLIGCCILELYGEASTKQMFVTDYIYESYLGYILMSADLVWLLVYSINVRSTIQRLDFDNQALPFYQKWALPLGSYFLAAPLILVLGHVIDPWIRYNVLFFVSNAVHAIMCFVLANALSAKASRLYFAKGDSVELAGMWDEPFGTLEDL